jgi:hypothetical protein
MMGQILFGQKTKPGHRIWLPGQGRGHLPQRRPYAGFVNPIDIHVLFFCQEIKMPAISIPKH